MYSHIATSLGNVDIELPLSSTDMSVDLESTLGAVAGSGGAFAGAFAPTLSQVAAYPLGAGLRPQDFLSMGS